MNKVTDFPKPLKAFLLTKFFAYSQSAFAQFLINIYFWRITKNIPFLVLFNVVFILAHTITYIPAAKIAKVYNRFLPLRIGTILQVLYILLILLLKENIVTYIIPVAIIGGVGHGAYWLSDNLLKFDLSNPENRLKFTASYKIIQSIAGSLLPLLASVLVIADGGVFHAYSRIFILAIACSVLVFCSSFFISNKKTFTSSRLRIFSVSKELLGDSNILIACTGTALSYVSSMMTTLLGLLLFVSSGSELSLGAYQFITVLIIVGTNFFMGKYLARKNYRAMLIWGGIANFFVVLILVASQSYFAIFLYGILRSIISFLDSPIYPLSIDAFNMYCKDQNECADKRIEYMVIMEFFVCLGSLVSLASLLILKNSLNPYSISIVVIIFAATSFAANLILTKIQDREYVLMDGID